MDQAEPASSRTRLFYIGRNSRGHWVVHDPSHLRGGLFVDRATALKFALSENGHRPQAIVMVPGALELATSAEPIVTHEPAVNTDPPRQRRAAA
jgi:hypothetical protein